MSTVTRVRYEVDPLNRLVIREPFGTRSMLGRRMALNGSFRTGPGNTLIYDVDTKQPQGTEPPLHRMELAGRWGLTPRHELTFTMRESKDRRATGETLLLRGALVAADSHALTFSLQTRQHDGRTITRLLRLEGQWQVDGWNRLQFTVTHEQGRPDVLTFTGAWQVGRQHELVYEVPLSGRQHTAQLRWQGIWSVTERHQLSYELGRGERLSFQAAVQSADFARGSGRLRYQVGIRLSRSRLVRREVAVFGAWRLRRQVGLDFEVARATQRPNRVSFGVRLGRDETQGVTLALTTTRGQPLGVTLTVSRSFLRDAEWFVRLRRERGGERTLEGAVRIPF